MHFHRDVVAMCDCFPRSILKAHKDDIFCGTPPLAFTFGLGGMLLLPDARRRLHRAGREAHAGDAAGDDRALQGDGVLHRADDVPRHGGARRSGFDLVARCKKCVSAGEALPDATRQLFKRGDRHRDHRRHRLDRDDPHLHLAHAGARAARRHRLRHPGLPGHRAGRGRQAVRAGRGRAPRGARARPAAATSPTSGRRTTCRTAGTSPATPT